MLFVFGLQQSERSWMELRSSGSCNNNDKRIAVNKTSVQQPAPLCRLSSVFSADSFWPCHVTVLRSTSGTSLRVVTHHSTGARSKLRVVTLRTSRYTWKERNTCQLRSPAAEWRQTFLQQLWSRQLQILYRMPCTWAVFCWVFIPCCLPMEVQGFFLENMYYSPTMRSTVS